MGSLFKLTCRVGVSSLQKQLDVRCVAAALNLDKFNWIHITHRLNYFSRNISLSSIVQKSIKEIKRENRKTAAKKRYSVEDDKLILEHVKKFGENIDTWKQLAMMIGRKTYVSIQYRYKFYIVKEPGVDGRFSPKEDEIILDYLDEHGKSKNTYLDLTELLDRGSPSSVRYRHEKLVLKDVRKSKTWNLSEDETLLKWFFKVRKIDPYDANSLENLKLGEFADVSQKLDRSVNSCHNHWQQDLLPIWKSYIKGLPLDCDWKKNVMKYIVNRKIRHIKELDVDLMVDEVCPGQTRQSAYRYVYQHHFRYINKVGNVPDLPFYIVISKNLEKESPTNSFISKKRIKDKLQYTSDIVNFYKSMI